VEARTTRGGKPYLALVLGDKSGVIKARVWDDVLEKHPGPFMAGNYAAVAGQVTAYQDEIQVVVSYLDQVEVSPVDGVARLQTLGKELPHFDPELLHATTPYDRQTLWRELWDLAAEHLAPPLQTLVLSLLTKYQALLLVCPAARSNHHAYLGGLLEHTWSVSRHALQSLTIYPEVQADLVLAGAILHDLGKIQEFETPQAPAITVPGYLLGHIVLGWEMVRQEAKALDFPDPELLQQLEHIILSHHGSLEFGSPVLPRTREALLVYSLDDLDAKMNMMKQHLQTDTTDGQFTSYHRTLQRGLYKSPERGTLKPSPDDEEA
jgi:3'-5' exoribonuclease